MVTLMLLRKEIQRLYLFWLIFSLHNKKMTIDDIIAWKSNITLFLPLFKRIFLHSRYTNISIGDTPSDCIQVNWFHLHKNMNIEQIPPNSRNSDQAFTGLFLLFHISSIATFYILWKKSQNRNFRALKKKKVV